jgi:hypothetical protein
MERERRMSGIADERHYSHEDWVDFVRDVAPLDQLEAMRRHLAAGCESCREVHQTWKAVLETVRAEPSVEPPAEALRVARALYAGTKPRRGAGILRATAKLLFDSQLAAAAAGVRTLRPGPRKLLYLFENEKFLFDLQVEPARDHARIVLIGQVLELDTDQPHVAGMSVLLFQQEKVIAQIKTNPYGEFRVEFDDTGDDLSLVVDLDHVEMVIALSDPG